MYRAKSIQVDAEQFTGDITGVTLVELEQLHENKIVAFYNPHTEELDTVLVWDWIVVKFRGTEYECIEVLSDLDFKRQFEHAPD